MRRRPLSVLLMATLCLSQVLVAAAALPARPHVRDLAMTIGPLVVLLALDARLERIIARALDRQRKDQADEVDHLLRESLEDYRLEEVRERRDAATVAAQVSAELARARAALGRDDAPALERHLASSLALTRGTQASLCANVAVAAVLRSKARQCAEAGVRLGTQVSLPAELGLDDTEVAAIFFNLIDNALHECEALRATGDGGKDTPPLIQLSSWIQAGQLFIETRNPCRAGTTFRHDAPRAPKPGERHGWGMSIVSDIAAAHGGIAEFSVTDGTFVASVLVPLQRADA